MVALKVTLPHLPSLSRHSSPSRSTTPLPTPTRSLSGDDNNNVTQGSQQGRTSSLGGIGAALRRSTSGRIPSTLTPPSSRPPSDGPLQPLRTSTTASATASATTRAHSVDPHRRTLPTAAQPSLATATLLQQSASQPPLSRNSTTGGTGKKSPVLTASSGTATPTHLGGSVRGGGSGAALHNLEESYVGKVSLKLGEAVNRVFLAGHGAAAANDVAFKGRAAPKVDKSREVGEMVVHELQAALHDVYLLRTLLRSSVLKSLSLFLTRLTALLLPSDAVGPPPFTLKEADALSPALKFNLQIVRCAYELKHALEVAGRGAPPFVRDTLRPWADKLGEVMSRVMNPLITSVRIAVSLICDKAILAETPAEAAAFALAHPTPSSSTSTAALKQGSAQLRSLSMGRAHTPTPGGASTPTGANQGPAWLRELTAVLDATVRMISRLECGADADKWLVSVGTHAVWKGMLSLSARRITDSENESVASTPSGAATPSTGHKTPFFSTSKTKRSPSPGDSPPLHPIGHPSHSFAATSLSEVAFLRLLAEIELLEIRLIVFSSSLSAQPLVDPHVLMSGTCADVASCGLCRTGRTFDAESSDDEDDEEPMGGLAQYAMREAMQALSAMVVVVRASRKAEVLRMALLLDGEDQLAEKKEEQKDDSAAAIVPLTPLALISGKVPSLPSPPATPAPSTTSAPTPLICPTLSHALDTLPTLILLHLLASRLPAPFQLPHQLWGIDWRSYEKDIKGFASGEEWTGEVAWEMAGEVSRCLEGREVREGKERERLECLSIAIQRKAGVEVQGA